MIGELRLNAYQRRSVGFLKASPIAIARAMPMPMPAVTLSSATPIATPIATPTPIPMGSDIFMRNI